MALKHGFRQKVCSSVYVSGCDTGGKTGKGFKSYRAGQKYLKIMGLYRAIPLPYAIPGHILFILPRRRMSRIHKKALG
jgi:hypothetical protein